MKVRKLERIKKEDGVFVKETFETVPEEKNFTKEVLKRMASNMSIDVSDLEPTAPVEETK